MSITAIPDVIEVDLFGTAPSTQCAIAPDNITVGLVGATSAATPAATPDAVDVTAEATDVTAKSKLTPAAVAVTTDAVDPPVEIIYRAVMEAIDVGVQVFRPAFDYLLPRGREAIGVDQPSGGSLYPFASQPSDDLDLLIADFYLSYADDRCSFTRPFHIAWLYGFGENPYGPLPGYPTPTHTHDILVYDADDNVVFDSTADGVTMTDRYWGDRLHIIEWTSGEAVCRAVYHTAWSTNETLQVFDLHLAPTSAVLDERTCEQLPLRVVKLQYLLESLQQNIRLVSGYNTTFAVTPLVNKDGGQYGYRVTVGAEPGSGLGRFDGCVETPTQLVTVNGVKADANGNFLLDAADKDTQGPGCYRIERPSTLDEDTAPPTATFTPSTLQIFGDCAPCCECDDFVNTYAALAQLWQQYKDMGDRAKAVRDQLGVGSDSVIEMFKAIAADCASCSIRMGLMAVPANVISATIEVCNNSSENLPGGPMVITISASVPPSDKIGLICGSTLISGDAGSAGICDFGNAELDGAYPVYSHEFDEIRPGSKASVSFRLVYPVFAYPDPVSVTIIATFGSYTLSKSITTMPTLEVC